MPLMALGPEVARRLREAELTYPEVGQTAGVLPPGYHHLYRNALIGSGTEAFANAAQALLSWQVQLRAGLRVSPSSAMAEPGTVVVLGLRTGAIRIGAPCRVVYVVNEPHRRGFAYGTLPGHPERGEEAFIIELHGDGHGDVHHHRILQAGDSTGKGRRAGGAGHSTPHHHALSECAGQLTTGQADAPIGIVLSVPR